MFTISCIATALGGGEFIYAQGVINMNSKKECLTQAANDMTYDNPEPGDQILPEITQFLATLNKQHDEMAYSTWLAEQVINGWLEVAKVEKKRGRAQKMNELMIGIDKFERRKDNLRKVCEWIFMFGWSSPAIINLLLGRKGSFTSQYCENAEKVEKGKRSKNKDTYFIQTATSAGSYQADFPRTVLTLNQNGYDIALERFSGIEYPEIKKDKIPTGKRGTDLRHSAMIQKIVIAHSRVEPNTQFISERMYFTKNEANVKKPDGIFITIDGWVIFLECELSNKSGSAFFKFVRDVFEALRLNRCHYVVFYTDSNSIFQKYSSALHGKKGVPIYENGGRLTGKNANFWMPPEYANRIFIHKMSSKKILDGVYDFVIDFEGRSKSYPVPTIGIPNEKYWLNEYELSQLI
jgi:hypothetical protein